MTMPAALRGNMIGGSVYEYGPHIFHTTDPEILAEIKVTMGPDLLPYKHTIRTKFLGNYFQFPLSMREALVARDHRLVGGRTFVYRFIEGSGGRP